MKRILKLASKKKLLTDELLQALSFYQSQNMQQILFQLGKTPDTAALTIQDLENALASLQKEGRVKVILQKGERLWLRVNAKRTWWQRLLVKVHRKEGTQKPQGEGRENGDS